MSATHLHVTNRREDRRLITGQGRYTSDWSLPNQLHAAFLRADRAHADIVSINTAPALKCPGVVAVFTGEDAVAAGYSQFPTMGKFVNRSGGTMIKTDRPVLAHKKVRFSGEAVALVVAKSMRAAQDAFEAIEIEYRDLPPVVTVDEAAAPGAPQIHANIPGNLNFEWESGDAAAVEAAFKQAAHVTSINVVTSRVTPSPMEPRSYIASYDAAADTYDIYTSAQGINTLRGQISKLTGVPEAKLRMQLFDVGGSFGQRSGVYPEHAALMMASKKLKCPVKWVESRSEAFLSDTHGRGIKMAGELALDRDGNFLAARYNMVNDIGAYMTVGGPGGHLRNGSNCMGGVYSTPALYGFFKVMVTNATPMAAYRGAGRPDIAYIVERLVDKAAAEMKKDRTELRRRNFIPLDAFPYTTPTGAVYEQSDFAGCMDAALKAADWAGFEARRTAARKAGKIRGIGLGVVIEGTGPGQFPEDQVAIEFDERGKVNLYTATTSGGQGHETTFTTILADGLGIALEDVSYNQCKPGQQTIVSNACGGSRSIVATGSICQLAAKKLIEQAKPLAAEAMALEPSQVEYSEGRFHSRQSDGDKSIGLLELAQKYAGRNPHPLNLTAQAKTQTTHPNGCHVAEVEIDPETGITEIVSYFAVDDTGNIINHQIVEGQVHGGVTQGAGQIFGEAVVYESGSGQMLTGTFNDYYMPHAGLIRKFVVGDHPLPSKQNELGAKGVGESGCTASLATLANAMMDALRPLGVPELDMPFTPSKVWHAIQAAKKK